ncbi:macoilin [Astyanax mexicanus]|uniref:Macoilin-like n=1 Tax=Astyanax mexicanus TaxID=7994 RepID=A0A8B9L552_ASTMX|nr:macoilin [Astyanax mexicanus]KAG9283016.1 macoilin-like [Astyanax mexicanus]
MKKRCVDLGKLRKMKKLKLSEKLSESAYSFLKFMIVWILVLLADFILEFRLEYLWPCWLFLGTVYTTFHCHGLAICVVFVCAAFTLDIFCLIFVPLHWLFFAASTYVLLNYIWHTEKGICMSTVTLWILLVYTEASLRLRDLKNPYANLSHLFAAHCIGYPLVYMGFDATCYFSSIFKLRTQKTIQSDSDLHMHLLQQSLPPYTQLYPKLGVEESKWRTKPAPMQYQCQNDAIISEDNKQDLEDCFQLHRLQGRTEKDSGDTKIRDPNPQPPGLKPHGAEVRLASTSLPDVPENLPQEDLSGKAQKASKGSQAKVQKSSVSINTSKGEKKQKLPKAISSSTEAAEKTSNIQSLQNPHAEQISKLEQEMRKLKMELQTSRQTEQELRSHICNLTNSENSLRPEVSLLRHANELLQNKLQYLTKSRQKDKQSCAMLEKRTRAETESRAVVEKQLAEVRSQKFDEAAFLLRSASNRQEHTETQLLRKKARDLDTEYKQLQLDYQGKENRVLALEKEMESLQKHRCTEQEADAMLSALSSLQDKAQHLEYNLSAETRLKLDLFSALGDARRQLELAQVKLVKQEQEIKEMKQKIAEVMAVAPGMSYVAPRPAVPQYLKFLNTERYVLNPRGLMYQCLKK